MKMSLRKYRNVLRISVATILALLLLWHSPKWTRQPEFDARETSLRYPLAWKHIHLSNGVGGAWYIPPSWIPKDTPPPANLLQAAQLASKIALQDRKHCLDHTVIPSIVHQTWKSTNVAKFPGKTLDGIEKWLEYAVMGDTQMAYFMWNDEGAKSLLETIDSGPLKSTVDIVDILPKKVEVADLFRVVVCNTIGGVYADIDTIPLRAPTSWVDQDDIADWTDTKTGITYGPRGSLNTTFPQTDSPKPVQVILGIEADNEEEGDAFWRMGYTYPVQLTQWSLAATPQSPALNEFLLEFWAKISSAIQQSKTDNTTTATAILKEHDPLELTGPVAITTSTKKYLAEATGLRWQGLSGLKDGGRSKVVLDTLILPITGFSPGRGKYGNMGSKPLTDADARVQHYAQGSWRSFHFEVELGKACRTLFGMCRDWSKMEES